MNNSQNTKRNKKWNLKKCKSCKEEISRESPFNKCTRCILKEIRKND